MSTGEALICKLKNISPIPESDNIVQANLFGETIIISKDYQEGQLGLLFDCESVLNKTFCKENNLFRHANLNKDTSKQGYFEDNPRVRPIKLRGIKVSGFWIPIESLNYTGKNLPKEGTQIKEWNEYKICDKYIKPIKQGTIYKNKKKKIQQVLNFLEHLDTDQLLRNLHNIKIGKTIIITTKVHGTSCRVGLLPCIPRNKFVSIIHKLLNVKNKYRFVVGSRHALKYVEGNKIDNKSSFYEEDIWTKSACDNFYGKLIPGETIYYEIVGYLSNGTPIMPGHSNECLKKFLDKNEYNDLIKKYGDTTTFHYGCKNIQTYDNGCSGTFAEYKIFVYRITLTTEHGESIDLTWQQVKRRCEELGVNYVPEIEKIYIKNDAIEYIYTDEKFWYDITEQDCKFFPQHINEGICVRIEGSNLKPQILKNKRYIFKVLEGIIKDRKDIIDIEENN